MPHLSNSLQVCRRPVRGPVADLQRPGISESASPDPESRGRVRQGESLRRRRRTGRAQAAQGRRAGKTPSFITDLCVMRQYCGNFTKSSSLGCAASPHRSIGRFCPHGYRGVCPNEFESTPMRGGQGEQQSAACPDRHCKGPPILFEVPVE